MSFHVPENYRIVKGTLASDPSFGNNGVFAIPAVIPGRELRAIASDGGGWEHVSVSVQGRRTAVPNWEEMCKIKNLFWNEDDVVIQFHPRKSDYVNNHLGCLHMWRPVGVTLPTPPAEFVGVKDMSADEMRKLVERGQPKPFASEAESKRICDESEAALAAFKQQSKP